MNGNRAFQRSFFSKNSEPKNVAISLTVFLLLQTIAWYLHFQSIHSSPGWIAEFSPPQSPSPIFFGSAKGSFSFHWRWWVLLSTSSLPAEAHRAEEKLGQETNGPRSQSCIQLHRSEGIGWEPRRKMKRNKNNRNRRGDGRETLSYLILEHL